VSVTGCHDAGIRGERRPPAGCLRPPAGCLRRAASAHCGCGAVAGQAAVELVALLPLLVAVALGILQALAAGVASELADHAAHSGAVAIAEGRDGVSAARASLPGWAQSRVHVELHGTHLQVRVTPPSLLPGVGERLIASATADAPQ
jgi:hypothetical protein